MNETKQCQSCKSEFVIESEDFDFYQKIDVPVPKMCPECRAQRRLAFRNERVFYKRKCDRCDKPVVSMYSPNKQYKVWCYDCWFADDWDPLLHGRNYDATRPFFEQFAELWKEVPKVALIHVRSVNSEYLNVSADNKDCYMIVESSNNEGCSHCYWIQECKDCVDTSFSSKTELCYECDDCYDSYKLLWSKGCHDSRESYFLFDCKNCVNCIGCANLRNGQYCVFNEQKTKDEYEKLLASFKFNTWDGTSEFEKKFEEFIKNNPKKFAEIYNSVNSTGNYIKHAKNCNHCFHCYESEDSKYGVHVWRNAKDCVDVDTAGRNAELVYNSMNAGIDVSHQICCSLCWTCTFMDYSYYCFNSNHCFGSVGLRKKEYCILNKKYSKEEFESLREKIISDMKARGEYGEFFPQAISAFGYNETPANEQFPMEKDKAISAGFKWEDSPRGTFGKETVKWNEFIEPDANTDSATFCASIFSCEKCLKNYRVVPNEFDFYKKMRIRIPRICPDCRHESRMKKRGPNKIKKLVCSCGGGASKNNKYKNTKAHQHGDAECKEEFFTSYFDEDAMLYCETCYQNEVS